MIKQSMLMGACALTMACAGTFEPNPTHQYAVYIDPAFSDSQVQSIFDGLNDWETKTGGFVHFYQVSDADVLPNEISIYAATDFTALDKDCGGDGLLGCEYADGIPSHIFLPLTGDGSFQQVATHEIGHSLGCEHIAAGNVMCKDSGCAAMMVQCGDVQELSRAWGRFEFDPSKLVVCQNPANNVVQ